MKKHFLNAHKQIVDGITNSFNVRSLSGRKGIGFVLFGISLLLSVILVVAIGYWTNTLVEFLVFIGLIVPNAYVFVALDDWVENYDN